MSELEALLEEIKSKMNRYDLSDEYLSTHFQSTRSEIGIGEYSYGITMIPCEWIYPYLKELKELRDKNALQVVKQYVSR